MSAPAHWSDFLLPPLRGSGGAASRIMTTIRRGARLQFLQQSRAESLRLLCVNRTVLPQIQLHCFRLLDCARSAYISAGFVSAMPSEEFFDLYTPEGVKTGEKRPRSEVHALGLYHKAVHVWVLAPATGEVLLQKRAACKDSWANRWDISSAGHISSGEESLPTAQREFEEELGVAIPAARLEYLFTHLENAHSIQKGKLFINNEFNDVYLLEITPEERAKWVHTPAAAAAAADGPAAAAAAAAGAAASATITVPAPSFFKLQESEVSDVAYFHWLDLARMYVTDDASLVPVFNWESYRRLFDAFSARSTDDRSVAAKDTWRAETDALQTARVTASSAAGPAAAAAGTA